MEHADEWKALLKENGWSNGENNSTEGALSFRSAQFVLINCMWTDKHLQQHCFRKLPSNYNRNNSFSTLLAIEVGEHNNIALKLRVER